MYPLVQEWHDCSWSNQLLSDWVLGLQHRAENEHIDQFSFNIFFDGNMEILVA